MVDISYHVDFCWVVRVINEQPYSLRILKMGCKLTVHNFLNNSNKTEEDYNTNSNTNPRISIIFIIRIDMKNVNIIIH
jgi:hypothetical protein